jgi:hypothetical protein
MFRPTRSARVRAVALPYPAQESDRWTAWVVAAAALAALLARLLS